MFEEHKNCLSKMKTMLFWMKTVLQERKPCINIVSKSNELTILLYSCHNINMKFLAVLTPPSIYQNLFDRGVADDLMCVSTTASVLSIPPVNRIVYLLESPNIPYSPPPQPLLWVVYPLSRNFSLTLSRSVLQYSCGLLSVGGTLLHQ